LRGEADLATQPDRQRPGLVSVVLETGHTLWVAREMLVQQAGGEYLLPLAFSRDEAQADGSETVVLPVLAEEAVVGKRTVDAGGLRVTKVVEERQDEVSLVLAQEAFEVERVAVGEFVEAAEPPEQDGDDLIVPLYEEVVVVEKRLRLKEKLIIRKRRTEQPWSAPVTRRIEQAYVERLATGGDPEADGGTGPAEGPLAR
jgi:uncharacterized protein (TIGR02271 family)